MLRTPRTGVTSSPSTNGGNPESHGQGAFESSTFSTPPFYKTYKTVEAGVLKVVENPGDLPARCGKRGVWKERRDLWKEPLGRWGVRTAAMARPAGLEAGSADACVPRPKEPLHREHVGIAAVLVEARSAVGVPPSVGMLWIPVRNGRGPLVAPLELPYRLDHGLACPLRPVNVRAVDTAIRCGLLAVRAVRRGTAVHARPGVQFALAATPRAPLAGTPARRGDLDAAALAVWRVRHNFPH